MAKRKRTESVLSPLEDEIMDVIWRLGAARATRMFARHSRGKHDLKIPRSERCCDGLKPRGYWNTPRKAERLSIGRR